VAWAAPVTPVSGTVITVAFAQSLIDAIQWLRQLTGGADPGGANKALYSVGTNTTNWAPLPDVVMANQKTNRGGDTMTGGLEISMVGPIPDGTTYSAAQLEIIGLTNSAPCIGFHRPGVTAVTLYENGGELWQVLTSGVAGKLWTGANLTSANGLVPSGMIAAFRTAAAIPSGWVRFTDGDGRFLIGAGVTDGVTFTEDTANTATWSHAHAVGSLATNTVSAGSVSSGGGSTATPAHAHTVSGSVASTLFLPPLRVVVMAIKS
jgi:hypothetical protein